MSLYLEGFECGFIYVSPFGKIAREEAIDRACWSVLGEWSRYYAQFCSDVWKAHVIGKQHMAVDVNSSEEPANFCAFLA